MKRRIVRFLRAAATVFLATSLIPWQSVNASEPWFAGVGIKQTRLQIADSDFQSYALAGHTGRWLSPGIGIQFSGGIPVDNDTADEVTVKINSLASLGLRLEGATENSSGLAASIVLGAAVTRINAQSALSSEKSTYSGYFISGGLTFAVDHGSQILLDYSHYEFQSDVQASDLRLTYRIRF